MTNDNKPFKQVHGDNLFVKPFFKLFIIHLCAYFSYSAYP